MFISVFSSMEIVGMAHCEIGIVQTEIEKQNTHQYNGSWCQL